MFVGGESGDGGFGLDEFEPQFFWPREKWEENVYTIQLTITSDIAEFFYFCHIHARLYVRYDDSWSFGPACAAKRACRASGFSLRTLRNRT